MGTTIRYCNTIGNPAVHPHRCGDNHGRAGHGRADCGSPPQVWGQHGLDATAKPIVRFTPTGVGTTELLFASLSGCAVHPHRCGDNAFSELRKGDKPGSPPQVWGQRRGCPARAGSGRFTPTGVGTTSVVCPHRENMTGSPPQVWGQLFRLHAPFRVQRFTPTGVGTTNNKNLIGRFLSVHPHRCGDNEEDDYDKERFYGSPPQVWGQHLTAATIYVCWRFTPTGVGTT